MSVSGALGLARSSGSTSAGAFQSPGEIIVGRDILELVSSAMYVDPMTVYREYVQNAADAVDEARRQGLLRPGERGRVDFTFVPSTRAVRIRDNGTGVAWRDFATRLTALGASGKRGMTARGFRGVGRLAGLGYAQDLIFRSRTEGEAEVSEMRWNCRHLRASLRAAEVDTGVADLVRNIVQVGRIPASDYPERFFEVELKGVVRLRSDKLMSSSATADYLSQVAPVPFSPQFRFGEEISAAVRSVVDLGELDIRIDGAEAPLYRPHRDVFVDGDREIPFERVEIVELPGVDCDLAGIAWVLHHGYEGAVPTATLIKGLRMRSGNIQVGDHTLLEDLFPEQRFNVWSVGEVHVIDRRVVPNGRRDHFEQNAHFHNLLNHLMPTARAIARHCRTSSRRRQLLRDFEAQARVVQEKVAILDQRTLGSLKRREVALSAEQALLRMEKVAGMDLLAEEAPEQLHMRVSDLRVRLAEVLLEEQEQSNPLARLPTRKREMYEHMFELIYDCSTNRTAAKSLVERILLKVVS